MVNDSSSESMDKFLNIKQRKEPPSSFAASVLAHQFVCVHGPPGSGKTWGVMHAFPQYVELDYDTLRSRNATLSFMERVRGTDIPIIVDDWEIVIEFIGAKEINGPLNRSTTVLVSTKPIDDMPNIKWQPPDFMEVGKKFCTDPDKVRAAAAKSRGDLHIFIGSLEFEGHERDIFETPKSFIYSLLCKGGTNQVGAHMASHIHEHGYVWGVVQENYVDVPDKPMEFYADVADSISIAGIIDNRIYNGSWDLVPMFNLHACLIPAHQIGHSLDAGVLRPGSMWTKYQNFCMRNKRLKTIVLKNFPRNVTIDTLMLIRDYCIQGDTEVIREYKFDKSDLDILNHLAIVKKIKTKTLSSLKKSLLL